MKRPAFVLFLAYLVGALLAQFAVAQEPCPNCGRYHGPSTSLSVPVQNPVILAPVAPAQAAENDGLAVLNSQRSARGLGPLIRDAGMMAGALSKATRAASARRKGHLGGRLPGGANKEGVGWTSGSRTFNACYAYSAPAGTQAGAALVRGTDGWYSCLMISHSGYLPSGSSGGPLRNLFRRRR